MATVENPSPVFDIDSGTSGKSSQEILEALPGVQYARYMFNEPTLDMTIKLRAFPSLTDSSRTRAQLDARVRWKLIKDLFWDLSYYNTYDSDPPSGPEATSDYGVITSAGWSS